MKTLYLDYASLTPIEPRVLRHMKKYMTEDYMNPSALYASAVKAKKALLEARETIAKNIHAHADEIIFTASGTEANNLALRGVFKKSSLKNPHIITSAIEHSSILETLKALEKEGARVTYLSVDKDGIVNLEELKKALTPETILVSIMTANNEIGTIEPLYEIAKIVRSFRKTNSFNSTSLSHSVASTNYPLLHTDACQAPLYLDLSMEKMGVDLLTLDGNKIYGPRGVGVLYIRRGIELEPVIYGGGQEEGLRSGTENIAGAQGFSSALSLATSIRDKEKARVAALKEFFKEGLKKINPTITFHGNMESSLPHILNISIPGIDNEFFVLELDAHGISCSTKSACLKDQDESYVLKALGTNESKTSVRFSFGKYTTKSDLSKTLSIIKKILAKKSGRE